MDAAARQLEILERFRAFDHWADRYAYVIELGASHPRLPEDKCTDETRVHGCKTLAWVDVHIKDGTVRVHADSGSVIMRGVLSLIQQIFDGLSCDDVRTSTVTFYESLDIGDYIDSERTAGLSSVVRRIKQCVETNSATSV